MHSLPSLKAISLVLVGSVGSGLGSKWPFTLRKPTTAVGKKRENFLFIPQQRFAQLLRFWCKSNFWFSPSLGSIINSVVNKKKKFWKCCFSQLLKDIGLKNKHIWIPKHTSRYCGGSHIGWQSHLTFNSRWAILSLSFILHSKEVQRSPHCCNRNDEMTIMTYHGN